MQKINEIGQPENKLLKSAHVWSLVKAFSIMQKMEMHINSILAMTQSESSTRIHYVGVESHLFIGKKAWMQRKSIKLNPITNIFPHHLVFIKRWRFCL